MKNPWFRILQWCAIGLALCCFSACSGRHEKTSSGDSIRYLLWCSPTNKSQRLQLLPQEKLPPDNGKAYTLATCPSQGSEIFFPEKGSLAGANEQHELLLYPDHEIIKGFSGAGWASGTSVSWLVESASLKFVAASVGETTLTFHLKQLDLDAQGAGANEIWSGKCQATVKTSTWQHIECAFDRTVEPGQPMPSGRKLGLALLVTASGSPCILSTGSYGEPKLPLSHAEIIKNEEARASMGRMPLILLTLRGNPVPDNAAKQESFLILKTRQAPH